MDALDYLTKNATDCFSDTLALLGIEIQGDLEETPARWVKAFQEMTSGYQEDPAEILSKRFEQPAADELVILKDIGFISMCEHHLLPFSGVVHIAYLPTHFVVGLSKLARLVDCLTKRLQIQERLTKEITAALTEHLGTETAGAVVEAHHSCMSCRGVKKPGATMITSSLTGKLRSSPPLRAEFLTLLRK